MTPRCPSRTGTTPKGPRTVKAQGGGASGSRPDFDVIHPRAPRTDHETPGHSFPAPRSASLQSAGTAGPERLPTSREIAPMLGSTTIKTVPVNTAETTTSTRKTMPNAPNERRPRSVISHNGRFPTASVPRIRFTNAKDHGQEPVMKSTMQNPPLLISDIFNFGESTFANSEVITVEENGYRRATFQEVGLRARKLATALSTLGVGQGDRVGTFLWNNQGHMEAYLAVPSMGSVLHTLNIRLFPEQLVYVINHAEDKVLIVDDVLIPLLAPIFDQLTTIEHVIVVGDGDSSALGAVLNYEELLAHSEPMMSWPELDETSAAAMCYTSGTTGNPKGVVYSHRSTYLHSAAQTAANSLGICESDRILVIVPMFHANAWGTPYSAWMSGSDVILPQQHMMGNALMRIIPELQPTVACGVPTVWNDLLAVSEGKDVDLSSIRGITSGGSAIPRTLIEAFEERFGVSIIQGWGMTETSPLAALAIPPVQTKPEDLMDYRVKAGRIVMGVEVRVTEDDGTVLPNDGESVGEFEIRGPWVTASYYLDDDPEKFRDGWLRTGDVGTLDPEGFMTISDRTKDVIKSGGEWISSVELEGEVMAHPDVYEAAVVAIPDDRWQERPLVCVVAKPGTSPTPIELRKYLEGRVATWWIPDHWAFVETIPKTSVGKFDKKVLRAQYANGELSVIDTRNPEKS